MGSATAPRCLRGGSLASLPPAMLQPLPIALGTRTFWVADDPQLFFLEPAQRRQHLYVVGKTGLGKTTLLRNMILQDLWNGSGVGLLDPHGDLAEEILDMIPSERTEEVLYFDPGDLSYPVGLNLLTRVPPDEEHLAVSGVVSAMKGLWGDSWGPRLEYILGHSLAALLDAGGFSLLALPRLLTDDPFRERVAERLKDPVVRAFFTREYPSWDRRFRAEAIAPIENKVGRLLASAPLRNILAQVRNRFDFDFFLSRGRIFIANLSKGSLGEDKANLMGSLLASQFALAALRRARLPEAERTPFYLYIDEFQSFTTDAFRTILAEARKYGLSLTLAHQYLDQLTPEMQRAVFGNVGTLVAFRVGERDAETLEAEFGGSMKRGNLVSLREHEIAVRLLDQGTPREPFRGMTLPPIQSPHQGRREIIRRRSREKYAVPRAKVEAKIERWLRAA